VLKCHAPKIPINQSISQSITLFVRHDIVAQLQQAEFGTGQTGNEVRLQLPKSKIYISVFVTKTFTTTEETEIQKQHKNNTETWRILVVMLAVIYTLSRSRNQRRLMTV